MELSLAINDHREQRCRQGRFQTGHSEPWHPQETALGAVPAPEGEPASAVSGKTQSQPPLYSDNRDELKKKTTRESGVCGRAWEARGSRPLPEDAEQRASLRLLKHRLRLNKSVSGCVSRLCAAGKNTPSQPALTIAGGNEWGRADQASPPAGGPRGTTRVPDLSAGVAAHDRDGGTLQTDCDKSTVRKTDFHRTLVI